MKTILVTGGVKGIGWGISQKFVKNGYQLAIVDITSPEANAENLSSLDENEYPYVYVKADISNLDEHQRILDAILARFGRIDILVNNAGIVTRRGDMMEVPVTSFDDTINTNLRGTFFLTQKIGNHMRAQEEIEGYRGIIVNISSMNAAVVSTSRAEYSMSKAGISSLTQHLAVRLGPESIFVYEIRPGIIYTIKTQEVKARYDKITSSSDEMVINRWGLPEDIAEAAYALCANDLRYCTGQVITVDGGYATRRL